MTAPTRYFTDAKEAQDAFDSIDGVFTDPNFVISPDDSFEKLVRVSEHYDNDCLIPDDVCPADIQQGVFPNCFLVVAASMLALRPEALKSLFVTKEGWKGKGACVVRIFHSWERRWVYVLVDDLIPAGEGGKPVYARSPRKYAWVHFLEKAHAKFYGGYAALKGGNIGEAFHDMTGMPAECYTPGRDIDVTGLVPLSKSHLIACGTPKDKDGGMNKTRGDGLVSGHAYGVLGVVKKGKATLVRLRNAQLKADVWKGKVEGGSGDLPPGEFYMPAAEFEKLMESVHLVAVMDRPTVVSFEAEWGEGTDGGSSQFATWRHNNVFRIAVKNPSSMYLQLTQPDQRGKGGSISYLPAGMAIVAPPKGTPVTPATFVPGNYTTVLATTFWNKRDLACRACFIEPGEYYVVPSTHSPGLRGRFRLSAYSTGDDVSLAPQTWDDYRTVTMSGAWAGKAAAGNEGLSKNPQYRLEVDEPTDVILTLQQDPQAAAPSTGRPGSRAGKPAPAAGTLVGKHYIAIVVAKKCERIGAEFRHPAPPKFSNHTVVSTTVRLTPEDCPCTVVVTTHKAKCESPFSLVAMAQCPSLKLSPVPPPAAEESTVASPAPDAAPRPSGRPRTGEVDPSRVRTNSSSAPKAAPKRSRSGPKPAKPAPKAVRGKCIDEARKAVGGLEGLYGGF